jgi:hypothetical protein
VNSIVFDRRAIRLTVPGGNGAGGPRLQHSRADGVADELRGAAPGSGGALDRLSRDAHALLRQIGREHGWPESYARTVEARYAERQRAMVRDLDREFSD